MQILNDFQTSVSKALSEINPKWRDLPGLIVCGTHAPHDVEFMLGEIKKARETGLPFLGICFGYQLAAIEYARNVLGIEDATSEEFTGSGTLVVVKRANLKVGLHEGESWWSNYKVVQELLDLPRYGGWKKPENFFIVPYHPEYQSTKYEPHPFLVQFLKYSEDYALAM